MTNKSEKDSGKNYCTIKRDFSYEFAVIGLTYDETGGYSRTHIRSNFKNITEAILFYENQRAIKKNDLGFLEDTEYHIEVLVEELKNGDRYS